MVEHNSTICCYHYHFWLYVDTE